MNEYETPGLKYLILDSSLEESPDGKTVKCVNCGGESPKDKKVSLIHAGDCAAFTSFRVMHGLFPSLKEKE